MYPQATYLNIFPLLMCTHMYRDNFHTKRAEFCFALNTFTYVSSTKRDSVMGVGGIRVDGVLMAGKPAGGGGGSGGLGDPASPMALLCPGILGPQPWCLHRLLIPQDGLWFAPDLLAVFGRDGQVLGGLHSSIVCWCLGWPHLLRCEATP